MTTRFRMTFITFSLLFLLNGAAFANVQLRNTEEKLLREVIENAEMEEQIFSFTTEKMIYVYDYEGKKVVSVAASTNPKLPAGVTLLVDSEDATIYMVD